MQVLLEHLNTTCIHVCTRARRYRYLQVIFFDRGLWYFHWKFQSKLYRDSFTITSRRSHQQHAVVHSFACSDSAVPAAADWHPRQEMLICICINMKAHMFHTYSPLSMIVAQHMSSIHTPVAWISGHGCGRTAPSNEAFLANKTLHGERSPCKVQLAYIHFGVCARCPWCMHHKHGSRLKLCWHI